MNFFLTDDDVEKLNHRLLAYLRESAQRAPDHQRIGPFLAVYSQRTDNPYMNYAIPDDGAEPAAQDIAALIAAFETHKRKPRLEYIAAAAPKVEEALLAHGFDAEMRVPVMICVPGMERSVPAGADIQIFAASAEVELRGAEQAQAEAYGSISIGTGGMRLTLRDGGVVAAARDTASGTIVGVGSAMPPIDGISEITGIGVRPAFRKRGIAGAVTALLTSKAFERGVTLAWLTPGGREAERIYARAGFTAVSEALHISL